MGSPLGEGLDLNLSKHAESLRTDLNEFAGARKSLKLRVFGSKVPASKPRGTTKSVEEVRGEVVAERHPIRKALGACFKLQTTKN